MTRPRPGPAVLKFVLIVAVALAGAVVGYVLGGVVGAITMPNAELEGVIPPAFGALAGSAGATLLELGVLYKLPRIRRQHFGIAIGVAVGLAILGVGGYAASRDSDLSLSLFAGEMPEALFITAVPLAVIVASTAASSRAFGWPDLDAMEESAL